MYWVLAVIRIILVCVASTLSTDKFTLRAPLKISSTVPM